ncbi:MAG: ribbon-helix-helix protein, CopG family [Sporichthyaceae bacterium]
MKRFQIYLDEGQHSELSQRAQRHGISVSSVIRRALETELAHNDTGERLDAWRSAVTDTAGSAAYLPEGRAYLDEMRASERAKAATR